MEIGEEGPSAWGRLGITRGFMWAEGRREAECVEKGRWKRDMGIVFRAAYWCRESRQIVRRETFEGIRGTGACITYTLALPPSSEDCAFASWVLGEVGERLAWRIRHGTLTVVQPWTKQ